MRARSLRRRDCRGVRGSATAKIAASSSFTRNSRLSRCCRSRRTSFSAMNAPTRAWSTGTRLSSALKALLKKSASVGSAGTLGRPHRRGQAATCRDRQGAVQGRRLLILDEPTSALSEKDSQALLDLLLELKAGRDAIIISHKLNEVRTHRRHGDRDPRRHHRLHAQCNSDEITEDRIMRDMVGRTWRTGFRHAKAIPAKC
jgi:ATPase subunit of ABC transporter with duplicated ATPase domains